jgi:hypothetical protein
VVRTGVLAAGLLASCFIVPHLAFMAISILVAVTCAAILFRRPSASVFIEVPTPTDVDDMDDAFLRRHLRIYRIMTPRRAKETTQQ